MTERLPAAWPAGWPTDGRTCGRRDDSLERITQIDIDNTDTGTRTGAVCGGGGGRRRRKGRKGPDGENMSTEDGKF